MLYTGQPNAVTPVRVLAPVKYGRLERVDYDGLHKLAAIAVQGVTFGSEMKRIYNQLWLMSALGASQRDATRR